MCVVCSFKWTGASSPSSTKPREHPHLLLHRCPATRHHRNQPHLPHRPGELLPYPLASECVPEHLLPFPYVDSRFPCPQFASAVVFLAHSRNCRHRLHCPHGRSPFNSSWIEQPNIFLYPSPPSTLALLPPQRSHHVEPVVATLRPTVCTDVFPPLS